MQHPTRENQKELLRKNDWKRTGIPPDGFTISPPDAKFSWIILIACCLVVLTTMTNAIVFGLSINDLIYALDTNMATLSWALAIASGGGCLVGPLVAMVINTYSCRRSVIIGGLICSVGLVMSSYVNRVEFLLVTFGVITGVGRRLIFTPLQVLLSLYFRKYLGIAMGCYTASFAASRLIMTPLIQIILDEYGFRGTFFIMGGVMLHVCLGASLFQPAKWHYVLIPNRDKENSNETKKNAIDSKSEISDYEKQRQTKESEKQLFVNKTIGETKEELKDVTLPIHDDNAQLKLDSLKYTVNSNQNERRLSELSISLESSWDIFEPISTTDVTEKQAIESDEDKLKGCCAIIKKSRFFTSIDYSLLKERLFYLLCIENAFLIITNVYTTIFAFQYGIEVGLLPMESAGLISARSFGEIAGRLAGPIIISFVKISPKTSYLTCMFLHGISLIVLTKMTSIATMFGVGGVSGAILGAAVGLHGMLIIEKIGVKKLSSALGLGAFFQSFYLLIMGPILGWVRDATGAYSYCLLVLGFVQFFVTLIWLLEPLIVGKRNINEPKTKLSHK